SPGIPRGPAWQSAPSPRPARARERRARVRARCQAAGPGTRRRCWSRGRSPRSAPRGPRRRGPRAPLRSPRAPGCRARRRRRGRPVARSSPLSRLLRLLGGGPQAKHPLLVHRGVPGPRLLVELRELRALGDLADGPAVVALPIGPDLPLIPGELPGDGHERQLTPLVRGDARIGLAEGSDQAGDLAPLLARVESFHGTAHEGLGAPLGLAGRAPSARGARIRGGPGARLALCPRLGRPGRSWPPFGLFRGPRSGLGLGTPLIGRRRSLLRNRVGLGDRLGLRLAGRRRPGLAIGLSHGGVEVVPRGLRARDGGLLVGCAATPSAARPGPGGGALQALLESAPSGAPRGILGDGVRHRDRNPARRLRARAAERAHADALTRVRDVLVDLLALEDGPPADVAGREWIMPVSHGPNVAMAPYAAVFSPASWASATTFWAMWPGTSS